MTKDNVSDPITDREMIFARLILSGTMTDRRAAEIVGFPPDSAAATKSNPRVQAFLFEHRDTDQLVVPRDQVLTRLWEIGSMDPERTRSSMSAQVKAIALIVAIQCLMPDRRAGSARNEPAPPPPHPGFYKAEWLRQQEAENANPPQAPDQQEATAAASANNPQPATPDPAPGLSESTPPSVTASSPYLSGTSWVPDSRTSFHIPKHPFGRRR